MQPSIDKEKKQSRGKLHTATDVLKSLLNSNEIPLGKSFLRWKLLQQWPKVVGPTIAGSCVPVGYHNGVFYLCVSSSAQMQELLFFRRQIQQKVNQFVGRKWVKTVRLTLDRKSVPEGAEIGQQIQKFS